jgi:hypothetical protein
MGFAGTAEADRSSQSAVAASATEPKFITVWTKDAGGDKDIYGRIDTLNGTLGTPFLIAGGAGDQQFPQVVRGSRPTEVFWVVYQDDAAEQIRRVGVLADGTLVDALTIASRGTDAAAPQHPTIACGGSLNTLGPAFCMVGYVVNPGGSYSGGIEWVAFSGANEVGRIRTNHYKYNTTDPGYDYPTIALAGSFGSMRGAAAFLLVDPNHYSTIGTSKLYRFNFDLSCVTSQFSTVTCTLNGFSLTQTASSLAGGANGPPRLAAGRDGYLLAWAGGGLWHSGVLASRLDGNAVVLDTHELTNGIHDAACTGESLGMAPSVAFSRDATAASYQYVIAWNQYTMPWDRTVGNIFIDEVTGSESGARLLPTDFDDVDMLTPPGLAASAKYVLVAQHYVGYLREWNAQDGAAFTYFNAVNY